MWELTYCEQKQQKTQSSLQKSSLTRHTELWEESPPKSEEASCCFSWSHSGLGVGVGVLLRQLLASPCWLGDRSGLGTSTWATSSTGSFWARYPSLPQTLFTPSSLKVVELKYQRQIENKISHSYLCQMFVLVESSHLPLWEKSVPSPDRPELVDSSVGDCLSVMLQEDVLIGRDSP